MINITQSLMQRNICCILWSLSLTYKITYYSKSNTFIIFRIQIILGTYVVFLTHIIVIPSELLVEMHAELRSSVKHQEIFIWQLKIIEQSNMFWFYLIDYMLHKLTILQTPLVHQIWFLHQILHPTPAVPMRQMFFPTHIVEPHLLLLLESHLLLLLVSHNPKDLRIVLNRLIW